MMTPEYDFRKIYDEYYQRIVQYLTRIVGPNDAEDIAQDVFDKINSGLGQFQGKSKLSTWIYRIATNTMIDRLRSAAYKHATVNSASEDAADPKAQDVWGNQKPPATDQVVIRKEMSECVNEFIDNLPSDYKTVIVLIELEGLAIKEIAEILGISVNNAKIRLHRARAKLKAALNEGCDFYHDERNTLACDRKQGQILPKGPK
jgi:RNA polymerase sigma-70 factor (ECF subfamily)